MLPSIFIRRLPLPSAGTSDLRKPTSGARSCRMDALGSGGCHRGREGVFAHLLGTAGPGTCPPTRLSARSRGPSRGHSPRRCDAHPARLTRTEGIPDRLSPALSPPSRLPRESILVSARAPFALQIRGMVGFAQSKLNESGKIGRGVLGRLAVQPLGCEEQVLGETGVRQPIGKLVKAGGGLFRDHV